MMLKKMSMPFIFTGLLFMCICVVTKPAIAGEVSIIPEPMSVEPGQGHFVLTDNSSIIVSNKTKDIGRYLAEKLRPATGFDLPIKKSRWFQGKANKIFLKVTDTTANLGDEGYSLVVHSDHIVINAMSQAGIFYGCQSLLQMLPNEIVSGNKIDGIQWTVPVAKITDKPRFKWRGLHLDSCRHFLPKEFVKKYIDLLALHKMNSLHWHLTEDQGWRIEIKKYPKLTEIGAWRKETLIGHGRITPFVFDGKKHGGFYTQDDIREIVAYAEERFVNIVPEIEMPGHAQAAVAAYPEYACVEGPFEVWGRWGVSDNVFCAGNDATYKFLEDVLDEVVELFPGDFIHVGGDECPKTNWENCSKCQAKIKKLGIKDEHELQSHLITHFDTYLAKKGKRLIGWDEILEGGLAPGAAVMSWRGEKGGIAAAKAGHDVVMTPYSHTYFDFYQGDPELEPLAIGGLTSIEKVYSYDPLPKSLSEQERKHIMGSQGQLWSEYIPTPEHMEYMAYPRACALSEVVWSPQRARSWDGFASRLGSHLDRLDQMGVNFRVPEPFETGKKVYLKEKSSVELKVPFEGLQTRYTLDGSQPTSDSPVYTAPINISETTTVSARTFMPSGKSSVTVQGEFVIQNRKDAAVLDIDPGTLSATASSAFGDSYNPDMDFLPIHAVNGDGLAGETHTDIAFPDDYHWVSADAADQWIVVDLAATYDLDSMKIWNLNRDYNFTDNGIKNAIIWISNTVSPGNPFDNAGNWTSVATATLNEAPGSPDYDTPDTVNLSGVSARYVAITGDSFVGSNQIGLSEVQFFEVAPLGGDNDPGM